MFVNYPSLDSPLCPFSCPPSFLINDGLQVCNKAKQFYYTVSYTHSETQTCEKEITCKLEGDYYGDLLYHAFRLFLIQMQTGGSLLTVTT